MNKLPMWIEREEGLRFQCTQCGDCCRGAEGYVWVEDEEVARLCAHLDLPRRQFSARYMRLVSGHPALVDKPGGDCVFWDDDRGCSVYEARPDQCRSFPFWPENLASKKAWQKVGEACPGVGAAGPGSRRYSIEEILRIERGARDTDIGAPRAAPRTSEPDAAGSAR